MREKNLFPLHFMLLGLVSLQTLPARADSVLSERLDQLYDEVSARFEQNQWFKNSSDPDVSPRNSDRVAPVPDYKMVDRDLFKDAMKSYCVLLESPAAKQVPNRSRYAIINFSQPSSERRLYIYDIPTQSFIHNIWTTHGGNSRIGFWWSLKDSGLDELSGYNRKPVLTYDDSQNATLFSNRNGSNQSSVGMAVADTQTYFSETMEWTALRLTGLDGALNSNIRSRAVVLHEWGFNGETIRWNRAAPLSEGCAMLPRTGTYQGVPGTEIAKTIMHELYGVPVLFYHGRMKTEVNESEHQEQIETLANLHKMLSENMSQLKETYEWDDATENRYESIFADKLQSTFSPLIEETYHYFQNKSRFYGVEPKNPAACMKALGI